MKKFISMAVVVVMVLAMTIASSADLVSKIDIVGTNKAPVLDGNITVEEWGEPVYTVSGTERMELQEAGTEDYLIYAGVEDQETLAAQTTGKAFVRWDADNLYLAYIISYPYHKSDAADASIWGDSMIQSTVISKWPFEEGDTDTMYELGFDLDDDLKTVKTWAWYPEALEGNIPGSNVAVVRKGTETFYEVSLSWKDTFGIDPANVKEGLQVGLSTAFNFKDEEGATIQYQVGGSLFTKDPATSIPATLVAAPAAAEQKPEETTDENTTDEVKENPTTADASAVLYVLASLSTLGGAVVIGKRK